MKRRRIFLTSACFFCAATGFGAGAQTCHTVRDQDGTIVYQSTRLPSEAPDTKQLVADAMQAGGTLRYESNFIRCGSFDRSAGAPIKDVAPEPQATTGDVPQERRSNRQTVFDNDYVNGTSGKKTTQPIAPALPKSANAATAPPNLFANLKPEPTGTPQMVEPTPQAAQPPPPAHSQGEQFRLDHAKSIDCRSDSRHSLPS